MDIVTFIRDNNALIALLGGALISVGVKYADHKIDGLKPTTVVSLIGFLGLAGSFLDWFLSQSRANPTIIGQYTATVSGIVFVLYNFIVKKAYMHLLDRQAAKASAANQEAAKTEAMAANGLVAAPVAAPVMAEAPVATSNRTEIPVQASF